MRIPLALFPAGILACLVAFSHGCGRSAVGARSATHRRSACAGETTYECLGAQRVRAHLVAVLDGAGTRNDLDVIERVAELDVREAIPWLHTLLRSPDVRRRQAAAAALGALRDPSSIEPLHEYARATERDDGSEHEAALDALDAHSLDAARRYAIDWMGRHDELARRRDLPRAAWAVDVILRANDASALPIIRRWSEQVGDAAPEDPGAFVLRARLEGARLQLGDEPFASAWRTALGTPDAIVPGRPDLVIRGLGHHIDDAPGLARFASSTDPEATTAYDGLDRLAPLVAADEARRARLVARLEAFTAVREDPEHPNFTPALLARHHATLARLSSDSAAARLIAIASDSRYGEAAYVAARHALRLELPGAADATAQLLASGVRGEPRAPFRVVLELLDAAAFDMQDGRWSVTVLDAAEGVRRRALFQMARRAPPDACGIVAEAAMAADRAAIRPGLTALTTMGAACIPALRALLERADAPPRARGVALEVLVMMRDPEAPALLARFGGDPALRHSVERAQDIAQLPDVEGPEPVRFTPSVASSSAPVPAADVLSFVEPTTRALRARGEVMQRCYEGLLASDPSLFGRVLVRFAVTPTGALQDLATLENTSDSDALAACVADALRSVVIAPAPPRAMTFAFPFVFYPTR